MAIQNRRGDRIKMDPYKLLPGEFAVPLDTMELFVCFQPGIVKQIATTDDIQYALEDYAKDIVTRLTAEVEASTENANDATEYANNSGDYALEKAHDAELAKDAANSAAQAVLDAKGRGEFKGDKGDKGDPGNDGVVTTAQGQFGFSIYDGNLILSFPDGTTNPDMHINSDGHLIYNIL